MGVVSREKESVLGHAAATSELFDCGADEVPLEKKQTKKLQMKMRVPSASNVDAYPPHLGPE